MGGMEFPEVHTLQNQTQVPYMLKQLKWDKTLANDILVTLDHVQLLTGFTTPVMQNIASKIDYIETSYLVEMRRRLSDIEGTIWIEHAWVLSLQRQRDESLMERFTTIPRITRGQLKQANTVRLYLRVITIADLTAPEGSTIPDGMLTRDWQAGSDLLWPDIPCLPNSTGQHSVNASTQPLVHLHQNTNQHIVGVYTVMVCRWTDHILARNPLLEVEADLS